MTLQNRFVAGLVALAPATTVMAAPQLYDTGPAEDASIVRFVAAVPGVVEVATGRNATLSLDPQNASTTWQPVRARVALKATLLHAGGKDVEVTVQPSEFVTLAAIPTEKAGGCGHWRQAPRLQRSPRSLGR